MDDFTTQIIAKLGCCTRLLNYRGWTAIKNNKFSYIGSKIFECKGFYKS